jgi:uncharacterized membrane protein
MKEVKKFFDNNRLNKGYSRIYDPKKSDTSVIGERYKSIFPPIDIVAQYEELNPGTFKKFLDMAAAEQNHKHAVDLLTAERYNRAIKLGRILSLVLVAIISLTTIILAAQGSIISAMIFCTTAFLAIASVSFVYPKSNLANNPTKVIRNNKLRGKRNFHFKNKK